jgi:hypothetical protein
MHKHFCLFSVENSLKKRAVFDIEKQKKNDPSGHGA